MLKRFSKYVLQSVAGMIGLSVYILADTFFIAILREQMDWQLSI